MSVPAKADETLKWREVQHFTWTQSQPTGIPDGSNHLIGTNRQIGIVFFQDGSTGTMSATGIFDAVVEVLRINPGFTIESYKRILLLLYKNPKDAEHRLDGLRKAGLPET